MAELNTSLGSAADSLRRFTTKQTAVWYLAVAGVAATADWLTKLLAVTYLTEHTVLYGSRFALMLVFNTGAAGGASWGPYTWLINVCLTTLSVLIISGIVAHLARVDSRAALALGLVAGGAIGNLMSMISGPDGVADFLAVRLGERAIVCNVADIALWSGALLLLPVIRNLVLAIRAERAEKALASVQFIGLVARGQ